MPEIWDGARSQSHLSACFLIETVQREYQRHYMDSRRNPVLHWDVARQWFCGGCTQECRKFRRIYITYLDLDSWLHRNEGRTVVLFSASGAVQEMRGSQRNPWWGVSQCVLIIRGSLTACTARLALTSMDGVYTGFSDFKCRLRGLQRTGCGVKSLAQTPSSCQCGWAQGLLQKRDYWGLLESG
jgi:hypothetical protein